MRRAGRRAERGGGAPTRDLTIASPRLAAYAALGAAGLLVALVFRSPEAAALGLPFLAALLAGLALVRPPRIELAAAAGAERILEGEEAALELELRAGGDVPDVRVTWPLPPGLIGSGAPPSASLRLRAGDAERVHLAATARRWGVYGLPPVRVTAADSLGLFRLVAEVDPAARLRVYPRQETLRRILSPADTQAFSGNELARAHGQGIEFADVRPYAEGDLVRHVNWRLSTLHGSLHVNETHPERNADVVLFLDTFSDLASPDGGTLELAVRAAASLAREYLARHDRVGLVSFGGHVSWLYPGMGPRQLYAIVEVLLDSEARLQYAWKGLDLVPPRTLPPKALVVALTPLLDSRVVNAVLDLRGRGYDLVVVEIAPDAYAPAPADEAAELARRLWRLDRDAARFRFRELGIAVEEWRAGEPLQVPIERLRRLRTRSRWVHA